MNTTHEAATGNPVSAHLHVILSELTIDQLYDLKKDLKDVFYAFPDKPAVYELSGISKEKELFSFHYADSVLGIDHVTLSIQQLTPKMLSDLFTAIAKIS